jgi:hypothetical protein
MSVDTFTVNQTPTAREIAFMKYNLLLGHANEANTKRREKAHKGKILNEKKKR